MMSKIAGMMLLGLSSVTMIGCASTQKLDIRSQPVQLNIYQPADPAPVKLIDMKFRVVTKENIDAFIKEQSRLQDNQNPVFVVIGIKDYKAMSLNLAELRRYINQQQKIIIYYKKATAPKNG